MKKIIGILLILASYNISAQVLKTVPSRIFTVSDSLTLKYVEHEEISFGQKLCYYQKGRRVSCINDIDDIPLRRKVLNFVHDVMRYDLAMWGYLSFYENGSLSLTDMYFIMEEHHKLMFVSLNGDRFYGLEPLLIHRFGSIANFLNSRKKR